MIPETYVDGIGWVGLAEGMIRIEFVSVVPNAQASEGQPKSEVRQRLIMTLPTFLRSVMAQQHVVAKLQSGGVLKTVADQTATETPAETPANPTERQPRSPNFHSE
jgi:hypothetical protein